MAEFLKRNRAEAIKVSIYEYNEELHLATVRQEGYEDGLSEGLERGITQGITQSIIEFLEELGDVPSELRAIILEQKDRETLRCWLRCAAKSESVEKFEATIEFSKEDKTQEE